MRSYPCRWCVRPTTSPRRVCNDCIGIDTYATNVPSKSDELTGGRWVIDLSTRVQVWEWNYDRTDMEAAS